MLFYFYAFKSQSILIPRIAHNIFCKKWNFTTEFYVMEKKDSLANNNNIFTNNNSNILTDKISINECVEVIDCF